jgi:hypothetical protein
VRAHALHAAYYGALYWLDTYLLGGYDGIVLLAICMFSTLMLCYALVCRRAEVRRRAQPVRAGAPSPGGLWNPAGLRPRTRLAYHIVTSWPPVVIRAVSVIMTIRGVVDTPSSTCTAVLQASLDFRASPVPLLHT